MQGGQIWEVFPQAAHRPRQAHQKPRHFIRLNREAWSDVEWWHQFAATWNGVSMLLPQRQANPDVTVTSDKVGLRGVMWRQLVPATVGDRARAVPHHSEGTDPHSHRSGSLGEGVERTVCPGLVRQLHRGSRDELGGQRRPRSLAPTAVSGLHQGEMAFYIASIPYSGSKQRANGRLVTKQCYLPLCQLPPGPPRPNAPAAGAAGSAHHRKARLDTARLDLSVERYFRCGLAASTQRSYDTGKRRFLKFCLKVSAKPLPVSEDLLRLQICRSTGRRRSRPHHDQALSVDREAFTCIHEAPRSQDWRHGPPGAGPQGSQA